MNDEAILTNEDGFTVFSYGDYRIRFAAPYSLEKYESVKEWDNGYLVVMAKYKQNTGLEEEYIDLLPILNDLYIDKDQFLGNIKQVKVANDGYSENSR